MTTVLEQSSSHIETQTRIMEDEYERFGLEREHHSRQYIKRILAEYETTDYISVPSQFVYNSLVEHDVPQEKILLIPFGTSVPELCRESNSDTFLFLFSGHLNFRKGAIYLLRAWEQLDLKDAELVLTSGVDEAFEPYLEEFRDDPSIRFLGYVEDLQAWFDKASVFVFPTLEEGSARVTYEAMACGLPLITTPNSGWVGSHGEHGLEVPIRDPEALGEAMKRMYYDDEERRRMGTSSREHIRRDFTMEAYGDRLYEAYSQLPL